MKRMNDKMKSEIANNDFKIHSLQEQHSKRYQIYEIFYSLQGEGFHVGKAAVFIRFSGCNLSCDFCDTIHENGTWMDLEKIIEKIRAYPTRLVILTGGEPGLWVDDMLIKRLHQEGYYISIETNGTRVLPEGIDWITCSPKVGINVCLNHIDEVKVVFVGQDLRPYLELKAKHYYLQPCSIQNTSSVIDIILHNPQWRLSIQTHKYLNIE